MLSYILVTDDTDFERRLVAAFGGALGDTLTRIPISSLHAGGGSLQQLRAHAPKGPCVVLLGADLPLAEALRVAGDVDASCPDWSTVLLGGPAEDLLPQAMHAGIRGVLEPTAAPQELRETVLEAGLAAERRFETHAKGILAEEASGKVIAVLSPKGGSGKTTVITNLAVALARADPGSAVLVDADLQFGDVTSALSIMPTHTVVDACRPTVVNDPVALKSMLVAHPSGLYVLGGADDPASGERVNGADLAELIRALAGMFPMVLVDTSAGLLDATLSVVEVATDLILVASLEVPSVRQLRKELTALDAVGLTNPHRHLVLNRADSHVGLSAKDVEAVVGLTVVAAIPSSRAVPLSTNRGMAIVESDPRSAPSRELTKLATAFSSKAAPRLRGTRRKS